MEGGVSTGTGPLVTRTAAVGDTATRLKPLHPRASAITTPVAHHIID
jgi:hypothetical protein